jgi:hypothetical protein
MKLRIQVLLEFRYFKGPISVNPRIFAGSLQMTSGNSGRRFAPKYQRARFQSAYRPRFGDENYGEGSSRATWGARQSSHAASRVSPRPISRMQGVLALTFVNSTDFDRVQEDDRVAVKGLDGLAPGKTVELELSRDDGSSHSFEVKHSMTAEQIEWFKAGSALNRIAVRGAIG